MYRCAELLTFITDYKDYIIGKNLLALLNSPIMIHETVFLQIRTLLPGCKVKIEKSSLVICLYR
jgi:hypothetical protein